VAVLLNGEADCFGLLKEEKTPTRRLLKAR